MLGLHETPIVFQYLNYIEDTDVEGAAMETDWERIVKLLETITITKDKRKAPAIIPARMKPKDQWVLADKGHFRIDDNFESVTMAVLDLDTEEAIKRASELFDGISRVVYSTHSYTAETPYKFRLVMELAEEIPIEDFPEFFYKIAVPLEADLSCSNISRGFYLPSHNPDARVQPVYEHHPGKPLTREIANKIANDYKKSLKADNKQKEYRRFIARIEDEPDMPGRRHFSTGDVVQQNMASAVVDCTFKGYESRHEARVDDLKAGGGRHDLAKEVIYNELLKVKDSFHLPSLMRFLQKASIDYSDKPLYKGNTDSEIPGLIASAHRKLSNKVGLTRSASSLIGSDYEGMLKEVVQEAIVYNKTGDDSAIQFPGVIDHRKKKQDPNKPVIEKVKEIKGRNEEALAAYKENDNWARFAHAVMMNENGFETKEKTKETLDFIVMATDSIKESIDAERFRQAGFKLIDRMVENTYMAADRIEKDGEKAVKRQTKLAFSQCMKRMKNLEPPVADGVGSPS